MMTLSSLLEMRLVTSVQTLLLAAMSHPFRRLLVMAKETTTSKIPVRLDLWA